MSSYTLADIRTDVKIAVSPEPDSTLTDAFYDQRINDAIEDIVYETETPEFEASDESLSLATDTRSYSMTGFDPLIVMSVKDIDADQVLYAVARETADTWDESVSGQPSQYFRFGTSIEVYPLPSSTYNGNSLRVRYVPKPTALSGDTDTSPLAEYFDRAIREYAIAACLSDLNEPELAAHHFHIYRAIVKSRRRIRGKEMRYESRRIHFGGRH